MNDKEIENEFEGIYKNQIEPNIHKLEDFRLKYAKKYNVVSRFSLFFISLGIILFRAISIAYFISITSNQRKLAHSNGLLTLRI